MKFIPNWLSTLIFEYQKYKRHKEWRVDDTFFVDDEINIIVNRLGGLKIKIHTLKVLDDYGKCSFDYDVIDNPAKVKIKKHKLDRIVCDILLVILEDSFALYDKVKTEVLNDNNENRDGYFEEFTSKRTIYKESSAVSKEGVLSRNPRANTI